MNELQRQAYLSAFGIENYMPRWQLVAAPAARQVYIPEAAVVNALVPAEVPAVKNNPVNVESLASSALASLTEAKPVRALESAPTAPINAASILQQLDVKPLEKLKPFALSVWRPAPGMLLIDSRDTSLALPTELLLSNILRALFKLDTNGQLEEVLRWPAVENRFVSRTSDAARSELQTWLAVEHELRPITQLWLMGENAIKYLAQVETDFAANLWQQIPVAVGGLNARMLPSLNQLLQQPELKSRLWACLKP